jgi:COP9 signalosome complex subunit 5
MPMIVSRKKNWVEVIGLMTGYIENEDTPLTCLVVNDAYPIGHGTNVNAWIRNPQSLVRVHQEVKPKGEIILGWYHSHPGYSPFMSGTDYSTQVRYQKLASTKSQFTAPIAVVLDQTQISTTSYGLKVFRLKKDLKTWEEPKFQVLNCPLESLPEMLKTMLPLTEGKGIFLEYE